MLGSSYSQLWHGCDDFRRGCVPPLCGVAALMFIWALIFGVCVFLRKLALWLETEKADSVALYISMCVVLLPRLCFRMLPAGSLFPFICTMIFYLFTEYPVWTVNLLCGKPSPFTKGNIF